MDLGGEGRVVVHSTWHSHSAAAPAAHSHTFPAGRELERGGGVVVELGEGWSCRGVGERVRSCRGVGERGRSCRGLGGRG